MLLSFNVPKLITESSGAKLLHYKGTVCGYTASYPLDLVSQCLPHAAALLWALLCVCGASVVHSHPHGRLRKDIYVFKQPFSSHCLLRDEQSEINGLAR